MGRGVRVLAVSAAAIAAGIFGPASASGAFPGSNGRIAFSQGDLIPFGDLSAHSQVFTIRPGGGGLMQLTNVAADEGAGSPDWSPDGERIAYISNETGAFQVWVMDADGSDQTQVTQAESGFEDFHPSWSPDGERILFSHCSEPFDRFIAHCDINVIDANGSNVETLLSAGHWTNVRPLYSPNGNKIAFASDKGGLQSAIWVMRADGSSPKRLTKAPMRAWWPDWAPSGKRILFSDHCCIPNSNLWTVRPGGGGLRQVTHVRNGDTAFASFSPNGKRIVTLFFSEDAEGPHILRADGSHRRPLETGTPNAFLTDWGPGT